jgi:soluble lytic murein transglycosylase-like protein
VSDTLYETEAAAYANQYGVPTQLFSDLINQESSFNPNAYNPLSGATGIAQFLPSTAADPGYGVSSFDPTNPDSSLSAAAQYLSALYHTFGSWTQALLAYSGSSGTTPYPGNQAIANDLQVLGEGQGTASSTSAAGSQTTPNTEASSEASGCTGWLSTPVACITATLTELGFVLLALVVIAAGLFLLRDKGAAA